MFIKLTMILLALLLSGCGTFKIEHHNVYYRDNSFIGIPITTDRKTTEPYSVIITRDSAKFQFRKEF